MKFKDIINKWYYKEAKWYHFWLPQSGMLGGHIFGFVVMGIVGIIALLLK